MCEPHEINHCLIRLSNHHPWTCLRISWLKFLSHCSLVASRRVRNWRLAISEKMNTCSMMNRSVQFSAVCEVSCYFFICCAQVWIYVQVFFWDFVFETQVQVPKRVVSWGLNLFDYRNLILGKLFGRHQQRIPQLEAILQSHRQSWTRFCRMNGRYF